MEEEKTPQVMKSISDVIMKIAGRGREKIAHLPVTKAIVNALGLGEALSRMRLVHVAGTKGKGTTSMYISRLLAANGCSKVGLFTSPHILDLRERFLIDNEQLPEKKFAEYFFFIYQQIQLLYQSEKEEMRTNAQNLGLFSFFMVLCVYIFDQENVKFGVIEVGIGGLLDSTNFIHPEVCVITALGFDHMNILGSTIESIAFQKCGIIKPDSVCFAFSQHVYPETRKIIEESAKRCGVPLNIFDFSSFPLKESWPALAIGGEHVLENSMVALQVARYLAQRSVAEPLTKAESQALRETTVVGRSQVVEMMWFSRKVFLYLDCAHTPESVACASKWFLEESSRRATMTSRTHASLARGLLFYSTRATASLLEKLQPCLSSVEKIVVAQIYNPKTMAKVWEDEAAKKESAENAMNRTKEEVKEYLQERMKGEAPPQVVGMSKSLECLEDFLPLFLEASNSFCFSVANEGSGGSSQLSSEPFHILVCGSVFLVADLLSAINRER